MDIQGIPGTIHEKREVLERMAPMLEVLNPYQAFVSLKNAFAIPIKAAICTESIARLLV